MTLYHYTSAEGLAGILKSRSIWASDARFLNDTTEIKHGLSIFDEVFASRCKSLQPEIVESIKRYRNASERFCFLVASFSQEPDVLSLWRGYNAAAGYCLGINDSWLGQNAIEQGFGDVPAVYELEMQRQSICDKLEVLNLVLNSKRDEDARTKASMTWWSRMLEVIMALKNAHFKEEKEYRLVKVVDRADEIPRRRTKRGLVSYLPVKLDAKIIDHPIFNPKNFGIERIIVGPALDESECAAVKARLGSYDMCIEVKKSEIPYCC